MITDVQQLALRLDALEIEACHIEKGNPGRT